ncbi:hypothetical protein HanXRQr2_Chr17g0783201 [Helianthus annuus]|uniref:Uncharacterized protein n=1 Tax=Helianthus annuus TaxID=4232 RepID=A0A9K3GSG4_HELAN|nr:hypothetical protein HanXRQr2_Chr17g0783201 [Helianthus annuus]
MFDINSQSLHAHTAHAHILQHQMCAFNQKILEFLHVSSSSNKKGKFSHVISLSFFFFCNC